MAELRVWIEPPKAKEGREDGPAREYGLKADVRGDRREEEDTEEEHAIEPTRRLSCVSEDSQDMVGVSKLSSNGKYAR